MGGCYTKCLCCCKNKPSASYHRQFIYDETNHTADQDHLLSIETDEEEDERERNEHEHDLDLRQPSEFEHENEQNEINLNGLSEQQIQQLIQEQVKKIYIDILFLFCFH
jgi:hypothetical protein